MARGRDARGLVSRRVLMLLLLLLLLLWWRSLLLLLATRAMGGNFGTTHIEWCSGCLSRRLLEVGCR